MPVTGCCQRCSPAHKNLSNCDKQQHASVPTDLCNNCSEARRNGNPNIQCAPATKAERKPKRPPPANKQPESGASNLAPSSYAQPQQMAFRPQGYTQHQAFNPDFARLLGQGIVHAMTSSQQLHPKAQLQLPHRSPPHAQQSLTLHQQGQDSIPQQRGSNVDAELERLRQENRRLRIERDAPRFRRNRAVEQIIPRSHEIPTVADPRLRARQQATPGFRGRTQENGVTETIDVAHRSIIEERPIKRQRLNAEPQQGSNARQSVTESVAAAHSAALPQSCERGNFLNDVTRIKVEEGEE